MGGRARGVERETESHALAIGVDPRYLFSVGQLQVLPHTVDVQRVAGGDSEHRPLVGRHAGVLVKFGLGDL